MAILVTGGTGYIGSHTVVELHAINQEVVIVDNLCNSKIEVLDSQYAKVYGKTNLVGQEVEATDLRGGASMVICGLIADGVTTITNVKHILRGYEDIIGKLSNVGAKIEIVD